MRSGNASHVVMKQVGHKTDAMLRRYQLVDERDLLELRIFLQCHLKTRKQADINVSYVSIYVSTSQFRRSNLRLIRGS